MHPVASVKFLCLKLKVFLLLFQFIALFDVAAHLLAAINTRKIIWKKRKLPEFKVNTSSNLFVFTSDISLDLDL